MCMVYASVQHSLRKVANNYVTFPFTSANCEWNRVLKRECERKFVLLICSPCLFKFPVSQEDLTRAVGRTVQEEGDKKTKGSIVCLVHHQSLQDCDRK